MKYVNNSLLTVFIALVVLGGLQLYATRHTSNSQLQSEISDSSRSVLSAPNETKGATAPNIPDQNLAALASSTPNTKPALAHGTANPIITITHISGRTITVRYSNLSTTVEGNTSPKSLWIQNDNFSKPFLKVSLNGASSGTATFTISSNIPDGNYTITPVGLPTSPYIGGIGPGWLDFGVYTKFSILKGTIQNYNAGTINYLSPTSSTENRILRLCNCQKRTVT